MVAEEEQVLRTEFTYFFHTLKVTFWPLRELVTIHFSLFHNTNKIASSLNKDAHLLIPDGGSMQPQSAV